VHSLPFRRNVLYTSVKANVSILTFCLNGLFIDESGVLRSAAIIVLLFLPLGLLTFALFI